MTGAPTATVAGDPVMEREASGVSGVGHVVFVHVPVFWRNVEGLEQLSAEVRLHVPFGEQQAA